MRRMLWVLVAVTALVVISAGCSQPYLPAEMIENTAEKIAELEVQAEGGDEAACCESCADAAAFLRELLRACGFANEPVNP